MDRVRDRGRSSRVERWRWMIDMRWRLVFASPLGWWGQLGWCCRL